MSPKGEAVCQEGDPKQFVRDLEFCSSSVEMWVGYDYNTYGLQVFKMKNLLKLLLMFLLSLLNRIQFLPLFVIFNCSFAFASLA